MKIKRQAVIFTVLGLGIITFLALWVSSERDNREYERYLSGELVNQIVPISSAPPYALSIIQDVLEKGEITKAQAAELENSFYYLAFDTQDITEMDMYLGRLGNYNDDEIVTINDEYRKFFMFLKDEMESNEVELTPEQLKEIEQMERLMQNYSKVVEDTLMFTGEAKVSGQPSKFFDYYLELGIQDDYWVELLKGYEKVTDSSYRLN
ncbi:hypothetical protein NC661_13620 [Aquibacillus koreensis]|uniref:Uncharacterized protein n=1 Tax=Aquibacillus koreensis TaxID=279446 RepID=A0A9X3WM94_9BACI|nr:hypothetical protein [Aquibacillus koreensis]MCT2536237.1 hypothetical protein [Aquibacillus koreensis]MDC3421410.1 hypothetical protein [Aquibacillus koreensis]